MCQGERHGIRVSNLLLGDVTSDLPPEQPPQEHLQPSGVPLADLVQVILLCLTLSGAKIDQVILTPVDPTYTC